MKMNKSVVLLVILSCATLIYGFNCTEYVTGVSEDVDRGHYQFCHTVLSNQKVINDNQRIINDNQRVIEDKLDALLEYLNISVPFSNKTEIQRNFSDNIVFNSFTLTPPILASIITIFAPVARQFLV